MDDIQFVNEVITAVSNKVPMEYLEDIRLALISVTEQYSINKQETHLVPYDNCIPECMKVYLVTKKIEGKSSKTLRIYAFYLTRFFSTVRKPIEEINANVIRLYLYTYQQQHNISNRTLDCMRACLSAFFQWAAAEQYITCNPTVNINPIKYERKCRSALTPIEVERIRSVCATVREKAIFEFFVSTGCRVSELCTVKITDMDIETQECDVLGKGNKHRKVYLSPRCQLAIKAYLEKTHRTFTDNSYLFLPERKRKVDRLSTDTIERVIKTLGNRAQIEKRIFPHLLRHTVATTSVAKGMAIEQVQKMLGHSNISTTQVYTHVLDSDIKYNYLRAVV